MSAQRSYGVWQEHMPAGRQFIDAGSAFDAAHKYAGRTTLRLAKPVIVCVQETAATPVARFEVSIGFAGVLKLVLATTAAERIAKE